MTATRMVRAGLVALVVATASGCLPGPPPLCDPEFSITGEPPEVRAAGEALALPADCDPPPPPPPDCRDCGGSHGDPHLTTFDQRRYDLQAAGELTAVLVDDIEVQLRMEPRGNYASVTTAVAIRVGADRFTLTPDGDGWTARHNGSTVELRADAGVPLGEGAAGLDDSGAVVASWPDGFLVHVQLNRGYSNVDVRLPDQHGAVTGLFGNANDDRDDDLQTRDGRPVTGPEDFNELYGVYAESWRVTDETSLFDYGPGESTQTYTDRDFPPERLTIDDLTEEQRATAEAICREAGVTDPDILDDCVLDVALTGDESFAATHARRQRSRGLGPGGAADDGPDVEDGPTGEIADAVSWLVELEGLERTEPPLVHDGAGHVLVHGWDDEDDTGVLVALDEATGEEVWRRPGLTRSCPVVATGDGRVVVQGAARGPLGLGDLPTSTIAVLDAATGELIGEPAAPDEEADEPRLDACRYGMVVADGMAVVDSNSALHGIDVSGATPRHAWFREHRGLGTSLVATAVGDGSRVVFGEHSRDEGARLVLLDTTTGRELDRLQLPAARFSPPVLLLSAGDDVVVSLAANPDDEDVVTSLVGLTTDGDRLREQWRLEGRRGDEDALLTRRMTAGTVLDDWVVGHVGQTLVAVEADTGDVVWTYRLPTFRNVDAAAAVDPAGNLYDGTFGGPWLLSIDRQGRERWARDRDELLPSSVVGDVRSFGPVVDGLLYVRSTGEDGPVVVAVRTTP